MKFSKTCKMIAALAAATNLITAQAFADYCAVTLNKTSAYMTSKYGVSYSDGLGDDSWKKTIEFVGAPTAYSGDEASSIELSTYVTVGFDDGATSNKDYVQIPKSNGMATGVTAFTYVINSSSGGSGISTTVAYGTASTKKSVKHPSGSTVKYYAYIKFTE
jgi:hypothetical protein